MLLQSSNRSFHIPLVAVCLGSVINKPLLYCMCCLCTVCDVSTGHLLPTVNPFHCCCVTSNNFVPFAEVLISFMHSLQLSSLNIFYSVPHIVCTSPHILPLTVLTTAYSAYVIQMLVCPSPQPNYPCLQQPSHPWSLSVLSTSSLFSFPLSSWTFTPPCSY